MIITIHLLFFIISWQMFQPYWKHKNPYIPRQLFFLIKLCFSNFHKLDFTRNFEHIDRIEFIRLLL